VGSLSLDQVSLVLNPLLLDLDNLLFELFCLLKNIILLGFHWSRVLFNTSVHEHSILSIKLIDLELFLINSVVSLLDVLLKLLNFIFFFLELSDKIVELLLEQIILLNTVKVINPDSGDLVGQVFDFNFFLRNALVSLLGLFKKIGRALFDGFLLGSMVDDVVTNLLCFGVEGHDGFLKDLLFLDDAGLFIIHSLGFVFSLIDGVVEHGELFA